MNHIDLLSEELKEYFKINAAKINCMANFLIALFKVRTVNLAQIATAFSGSAQVDSHYKRLQRFFKFFKIEELSYVQAIIKLLCIHPDKLVLAIDRTNWLYGKKNINILTLAIAHDGIAFPILFDLLNKKGNSNTEERKNIMIRFLEIMGADRIDYLTGDREFIGQGWFDFLLKKKISFRIRIRKTDRVANSQGELVAAQTLFRNLKVNESMVLEQKRKVWGHSLYVEGLRLPDGELLIVVSPDSPKTIIEDYARRWEIETLFGCLKTRGFNLESTHMVEAEKIRKMVALLAIALCWAYRLGEVLNEQKPIKIKKHGRKAKSLFRYGLDWIRNILFNIDEQWEEYVNILAKFFQPIADLTELKCCQLESEIEDNLLLSMLANNYKSA